MLPTFFAISATLMPEFSSPRIWSDFDEPPPAGRPRFAGVAPAAFAALAFANLPVPRFADFTMPSSAWARPNMIDVARHLVHDLIVRALEFRQDSS